MGFDFATVVVFAGLAPLAEQLSGLRQQPFAECCRAIIPPAPKSGLEALVAHLRQSTMPSVFLCDPALDSQPQCTSARDGIVQLPHPKCPSGLLPALPLLWMHIAAPTAPPVITEIVAVLQLDDPCPHRIKVDVIK